MPKQPTIYEERRRKLKLNILEDLYNLRALTTEQLSSRFDYSIRHIGRITRELQAEQLLITEKVRGYERHKGFQGNYYRISTKGIRYLNQADFKTSRTADQLRVSEYYLPYILSLNDLYLRVEPHGWEVINSRDVKAKFNLNRGDNIHGMLISPDGTKYGIYIFLNSVIEYNMKKIKSEISRYNNTDFPNMLILCKNEDGFNQVVSELHEFTDIVKYVTFKVLPFGFGIKYLKTFGSKYKELDFLSNFGVTPYPEADISEAPMGLETVVIHEDEEKYLVNMLDNDLEKLRTIRNYRKERYEFDGRKVLIVTNMDKVIPELLEDIHHIDYLHIAYAEMADYFRDY